MARESILVVDDDPVIGGLVSDALGTPGQVTRARTGAEALGIVRGGPVALVLLDYRLPDRNGLDVLADMKRAAPSIPVIMIAARGSERICASAFKLGASDYLAKPIDVAELATAVRAVLGRPRQGRAKTAHDGNGIDAPMRMPGARCPDQRIQRAIHAIGRRYGDAMSLAWLAREVGMSRCGLSHRFTKVTGLPFRAYLLGVRMERAKEYLAAGQVSITEVAQAVGFGDLPRFDKLFKRYTGLTPSAYRSRAGASGR
jgi:YesN/AraC family two-component response regulator